MPKPYPREFRDDVVRVARTRGAGVTLEQIANDFGVQPMTFSKWLSRDPVVDPARPPSGTHVRFSVRSRF